jgi:Uma2 family endonuclease
MSCPASKCETPAMSDTLELPPPGQATYADLEALPERYVGEIIDGTLYAQARPASPHAVAASVLGARITAGFHGAPFESGGSPGGWWILDEPELHFGADVLVPDIAGWRQERMPRVPRVPWFDLAPDWVCEVASPATERLDRGPKLERYFRAGVAHVWLVEPLARRVEVLRRSDAGWLLVGNHFEEEVVGIEPFAAVPLNLAELWLD